LTAIALAAALKPIFANLHELDGYPPTRHRAKREEAAEFPTTEMLELASLGAKVMQTSVEFAKNSSVLSRFQPQ